MKENKFCGKKFRKNTYFNEFDSLTQMVVLR
jgi:hypothetical protein